MSSCERRDLATPTCAASRQRGHRYTTRSDTETILHAYEEYGTKCVTHLRDVRHRDLGCKATPAVPGARPHGKKPSIIVCSAPVRRHAGVRLGLKAVLAHLDVLGRLDGGRWWITSRGVRARSTLHLLGISSSSAHTPCSRTATSRSRNTGMFVCRARGAARTKQPTWIARWDS